jgi:sigma-B regulation protein RsbU (phosphoserine phosphatase)
VLHPERARLEYVNAGHVPPIVYRAHTGDIEWLGEGGIAMGVEPEAGYKVGRIELDPGDMLVLYSDGVTEARRLGQPYGQGKFSDLVELYGIGTPGEMVQAIRRGVEAWVGDGEMRDDLALLACQVAPDTAIAQPERELVLPNEPARLSEIRAFVTAFLNDVRVSVDDSQDISIAVAEASGNAVLHGRRPGGRGEIRVGCKFDGEGVTLTIADDGPGFELVDDGERVPDRYAAGGRGLFLMRKLMDSIDIESSAHGTKVVLYKQVSEKASQLATITADGEGSARRGA